MQIVVYGCLWTGQYLTRGEGDSEESLWGDHLILRDNRKGRSVNQTDRQTCLFGHLQMGEGGGGGGVRAAKCHMRISNFKVSKSLR